MRLRALEQRIEADLALGRHAEVIPDLQALVREELLRERLRGQLMLALYRSGRQAEALDVYRQGGTCLPSSSAWSRANHCGSSSAESSTTIRLSAPSSLRVRVPRSLARGIAPHGGGDAGCLLSSRCASSRRRRRPRSRADRYRT